MGFEISRKKSVENTRDTVSEWDSLEEFERFNYSPQEFGEKLLEIDRLLGEFGGEEKSDLDQMRGQESEENILGNDEPQSKSEGQRTAEESIRMFEDTINNSSDDEQKNETPISGLF